VCRVQAHRKKSKLAKAKLPAGVTEDEFGELKVKLKPERSLKQAFLRQAEDDIYTVMSQRATQELHAQEDARVFAMLDASLLTSDQVGLVNALRNRLRESLDRAITIFRDHYQGEIEYAVTSLQGQMGELNLALKKNAKRHLGRRGKKSV
jgi:hypothetical protein